MHIDLTEELDEESSSFTEDPHSCKHPVTQYGATFSSELPQTPEAKISKRKKRKSKSPLAPSQAKQQQKNITQMKDAIKQAKAQEKVMNLQRHGHFRTEELSLVLPHDVYNSALGSAVLSHLMFASDNDKSYGCLSAPSTVPGLCRWTFRNYLDGGSATVGETGSVVLPFVVIVFSPRTFLELVEASPDGEEFPLLEEEVKRLREGMAEEGCPTRCKLVLLLVDMEAECSQYQKVKGKDVYLRSLFFYSVLQQDQRRDPSLRSTFPVRKVAWSVKLDEAAAFLLYRDNIDLVQRPSGGSEHKQVAQYFETVTRCLGEQASQQSQKTGLETIRR